MDFLAELKRRRVFRAAGMYAVAAWVIIQAADIVAPRLGMPDWTVKFVIVVAVLGLPIVLILSWLFDLKREQSRSVGLVLIGMVISLVVFGSYWRIQPHERGREVDANSLAVLPFVDMSPNHDQAYFGDGITEEILNVLAQVPELRVPARTSSFAFRGKDMSVHDIAQQLGVAHVLEGSVRKSGNRVRITAQLIDARNDTHLWSEMYDRNLEDVFAVQDEIAHAIAEAMQVRLQGRVVADQTSNGRAHEFYLKGLYYWNRRHADEVRNALEQFQAATAEDPKYARAYAGIALTYAILPQYIDFDPREASKLGKAAAARALQLDPKAADAHAALGQIAQELDWDWKDAQLHLMEAVRIDPKYATAHQWLAELYQVLGKNDLALQEAQRALELDPLSSVMHNVHAMALMRAGRTEEGISELRAVVERDPGYQPGRGNLMIFLARNRRFDDALRYAQNDSGVITVLQGMKDPARAPAALQLLQKAAREPGQGAINLAYAYIVFDRPDSAAAILNRIADGWVASLPFVANDPPAKKALSAYPDFQQYRRKVHLQ